MSRLTAAVDALVAAVGAGDLRRLEIRIWWRSSGRSSSAGVGWWWWIVRVEMFNEVEALCLLTVPEPYDVPRFTRVKVHRDFHVEVARALYSLPEQWIGHYLEARSDLTRAIWRQVSAEPGERFEGVVRDRVRR
ncbi:MAG: Mu transposase domain-containing protein [Propionibacteriaceae bacterium]